MEKVTFLVDNVVAGTSNINKGVATYNYMLYLQTSLLKIIL